jgi:hypothetical protein
MQSARGADVEAAQSRSEAWGPPHPTAPQAILSMFSDTDNKVDLGKAIYLIGNEGSLVAYYHGDDIGDPDERLAKIIKSFFDKLKLRFES